MHREGKREERHSDNVGNREGTGRLVRETMEDAHCMCCTETYGRAPAVRSGIGPIPSTGTLQRSHIAYRQL